MGAKRKKWLLFIVTALAGTGLHYLYALCPNPLFALIAPINESVWEHLKLLFWPFLAASWFLVKEGNSLGACLAAELGMPCLLLGVYYTLSGGFGLTSPVIDIGLYYLTLAAGFAFVRVHRSAAWFSRAAGVLAMLTAMYATLLLVFSIAAPDFAIFSTVL
jgi:hypothetical protein